MRRSGCVEFREASRRFTRTQASFGRSYLRTFPRPRVSILLFLWNLFIYLVRYEVAKECIKEGVNYVDLADGREFVAEIDKLDEDAKKNVFLYFNLMIILLINAIIYSKL